MIPNLITNDTAIFHVIYQTRGRVFHPISKNLEVGWKKPRRNRVFLNQRGGWNTLSSAWCNISNTRHSVSSQIKHREESWKYDA